MATRTWLAGGGAWGVAADWSGGVAPNPGDAAVIGTGTVTLAGSAEPLLGAYDAVAITLASVLVVDDALLGKYETLSVTASSTLESIGASGFEGTLNLVTAGATLTLEASQADGAVPGDLVFLNGAVVNLDNGATLVQQGRLDVHNSFSIGNGGTLVADGTIRLSDGLIDVQSGGAITGTGTVHIGRYSSLYLEAGSAASSIAVTFDDVGGRLLMGTPGTYTGQVGNFMVGDIIDLLTAAANYAYYDAGAGLLTVRNGGSAGAVVASLNVQSTMQSGTLAVSADGGGGVDIAAPSALARTTYTIAGPDIAQGSDVVRARMTTSGGAALTGAGIKIGIISSSFDVHSGVGAADPANADAIAGYLPLEADGVTCAVTVLQDDPTSTADEGRAMAELIHQVAPGAQLYFTTGDTYAEFASGVAALQAQGCTVIVDDLTYLEEPMFQDAGPLDAAIGAAVAGGVSYFTAAGNFGDAAFEASGISAGSFKSVTLHGGTVANSYIFDNGTAYQTITDESGSGDTMTLELQWDAPVPALNVTAAQLLVVRVFSMSGALVAISTASSLATAAGTQDLPGVEVSLPGATGTQYQIAISLAGGAAVPDLFKYILSADGSTGSGPGGVIDDPAAQQGAGTSVGHEMLPDVNSVGAISYANTPAFGAAAGFTEYYSSVGAGAFLYGAGGSKLAAPETGGAVSLLAPVGAATAVSGFTPFDGTSAAAPDAAAVAALMLQANPNLTPAKVTSILDSTATSLGLPAGEQGAGVVNAVAAVTAAEAACYAAGTKLLTPAGERAIETLRVGDVVVTLHGAAGRVRWLGWRRQRNAIAIRIRAGALAEGMPHADLVVSPDHALWREGALVPARLLANGRGICRERHAEMVWWHVELDRHGIVLAEGVPAETYLDTGNRGAFANGVSRPAWPGFASLAREHRGFRAMRVAKS